MAAIRSSSARRSGSANRIPERFWGRVNNTTGPPVDVEAVARAEVQRHGHHLCPHRLRHGPGRRKAGAREHDAVPRLAGDQSEQKHRRDTARGDEHVAGADADLSGDELPQLLVAPLLCTR